jgi:hypothetical protein
MGALHTVGSSAKQTTSGVKGRYTMRSGNISSRRRQRTTLLTGLILVVILGGISAMLGSWNAVSASITFAPSPIITALARAHPIVGSASFESSEQVDVQMTQGINDELQLDLYHIPNPDPGTAYYAWLLPDRGKALVQPVLLGRLTVTHAEIHLHYGGDQQHTDLLQHSSRLLITEEDAAVPPHTLSLDSHRWRYYGEIAPGPNPAESVNHTGVLDHIRLLLVGSSPISLPGGLRLWLLLETRNLLEWATAARGSILPEAPPYLRVDLVHMLDELDGSALVSQDVPVGTPLSIDPQLAQVPLLAVQPGQQPTDYITQIEVQLAAISQSPGATDEQQQIAVHVTADLKLVADALGRVREDARQLLLFSDAQLAQPAALSLLNDLVEEANTAYAGLLNPATGVREGGAVSIADQLECLAAIGVLRCISCHS